MKKKKISLKDWVDENHKILTLLGLFAALIVFFNNLYISSEIDALFYLSFISFLIFLLFCLEIWTSFPSRDYPSSFKLTLLEILFMGFFFLIVSYVWTEYKEIILKYLIFAFFVIYGFISVEIIKRTKIYLFIRKTRGKRAENIISYIFALVIFIIILILSFLTQKLVDYLIQS